MIKLEREYNYGFQDALELCFEIVGDDRDWKKSVVKIQDCLVAVRGCKLAKIKKELNVKE